jgi:hypothetical protein
MLAFDITTCAVEAVDRIPCGDLLADTSVPLAPPGIPDCDNPGGVSAAMSILSSDGSLNVAQTGAGTIDLTLPNINGDGTYSCVFIITAINWDACTYTGVYAHVDSKGRITLNDTPC